MFLIALLILFQALFCLSDTAKCKLSDYCQPNGVCKNFTSLAEVSEAAETCLRQDEHSLIGYFNNQHGTITFVSHTEQEINNKFDFHFWKWILYNNVNQLDQHRIYTLNIWNVGKIDYDNYPSEYYTRGLDELELYSISIQIVKNRARCSQNTSSWSNFLHSVTHRLQIHGGRYFNYMCPFWFQNVELDSLTVSCNHGFRFKQVGDTPKSVNISSNISSLVLNSMHKLVLNQNLLSTNVFGSLQYLTIRESSMFKISPTNLFEAFSLLKSFELIVINTQGFFHSTNGTEWMAYLNYHVYFDLDQFILKKMTESDYQYIYKNALTFKMSPLAYENSLFPYNWYIYPDEDICLFRDFPHRQLVVPIINSVYNIECSCTLAWLLKFNSLVYHRQNLSFFGIGGTIFQGRPVCHPEQVEEFTKFFDTCNMSLRLGLCSIQNTPASHDAYFDLYDLKNGIQAAHLYLLDYAGPVICVIGLFANLIVVVVFLHNKYDSRRFEARIADNSSRDMVLFDERLYQLMFINAVINLVYCLMYLLDFTITCTPAPYYDYNNDLELKNIYTYENCLVKDCVIGYIGSCLKIVSNTLLVFISLNRYILIGREHKKFVIKLTSISIRNLLIWSTIVASLLNVIVVFQYITWSNQKVVTSNFDKQTVLYSYDYYPFYENDFLRYRSVLKRLQQISLLIVFSVIHDCFSYLFFCVIILILDIATVKKLRETLAQKSNISKVSENKEKMEQNSITMVWINSIVNFILRLPEILSMVCFIFFDVNPYIYKVLCLMFNRCLTLYDLSNVAYILSLSTPLFFYLGFNTNFDTAFKAMWKYFNKKESK